MKVTVVLSGGARLPRKPVGVVLGQAPARGARSFLAGLRHGHGSGAILGRWMGIGWREFNELFRCTNVVRRFPGRARGGKGDIAPGAGAARAARSRVFSARSRLIVAVGAVAASTALGRRADSGDFGRRYRVDGAEVHVLPHPSGINRWLNEPENRTLAVAAARRAVARAWSLSRARRATPP